MTVVCAVHDRGETWIGCDTRACRGETIIPAAAHKWHVHDRLALGVAGDSRVHNIVGVSRETLLENDAPFAVAEALRKVLKEYDIGFAGEDRAGVKSMGQFFILATPKAVFSIGACLAVSQISDGWLYAVGSGAAEAHGAGHALRQEPPQFRVRAALLAAMAFDAGCGGETWIRQIR